MRVRLSSKGDILQYTKAIFDFVSVRDYKGAEPSINLLQSALTQYYVSRGLDRKNINTEIYYLRTCLRADQRRFIFTDIKEIAYNRLEHVLEALATEDVEQIKRNKYERLLQIYENIQEDVEQFSRSRRSEDAESIRGDFADVRALEDQFATDDAEYTLYQDLIKQVGLCGGVLVRASFGEKGSPDMKKLYISFENLFPKIESLIASKKFRKLSKETEWELPESKVKEINDLAEQQEMTAEEIAKHLHLSKDVIEDVLFPE